MGPFWREFGNLLRHAGLDPASIFLPRRPHKKMGSGSPSFLRAGKSGVTRKEEAGAE
jgi:hypothetical protein